MVISLEGLKPFLISLFLFASLQSECYFTYSSKPYPLNASTTFLCNKVTMQLLI